MFEIGVVAQFEAAHALKGDFGPATRRHGHTYRVEVSVRGDHLRANGTLCDLGLLKQVVEDAVGPLDYQDFDSVPALEGSNTTAEVVAQFLANQIAPQLEGQGVVELIVRLWESPIAFASCSMPLRAVKPE